MANNAGSSMQSDQYFAEMLQMMREQGNKDNPTTLQLGVMQSVNSVKINDLVLYAEDLYIAEYLVEDGLKKGDLVAVQRLQGTNRYVILVKVVEA
jgi:hypothetical protein